VKAINGYVRFCTTLLLVWFTITASTQPLNSNGNGGDGASFAIELIDKMFAHCSNVETMTCEVKKRERYDGKYVDAHSLIKMSCDPYCVYLKQLEPSGGVEVLYRESWNNGKVLVNPNGFPWINISLDPYSSLIRSKQHHLISDIGFSKFNRVLDHLLKKYANESEGLVNYVGTDIISGRACHVVDIKNKHYKLIDYHTQAGETTMSISEKFKISEYRIIELNSSVSGYGAVKPGLDLIIPNDYAPEIRLYIDSERYIPMRFEVYDDQGELFEAYEYEKVVINPRFSDKDLSKENPEYGF